jgi:hypothetical protein
MSNIPKILLQVSKEKPSKEEVEMVTKAFPGWEYMHFNDDECIEYIRNNPIKSVPKADRIFLAYKVGAHRADFFRYYFLYLNGGAFLDSDLIIYENIQNIIDDSSFISCEATAFDFLKNTIFQGFMVCDKNNPIVYAALTSMYNMVDPKLSLCNSKTLQGYLSITEKLYRIVYEDFPGIKVKMLRDKCFKYLSEADNQEYIAFEIYDGDKVVGVHWQQEDSILNNYNSVVKWSC